MNISDGKADRRAPEAWTSMYGGLLRIGRPIERSSEPPTRTTTLSDRVDDALSPERSLAARWRSRLHVRVRPSPALR